MIPHIGCIPVSMYPENPKDQEGCEKHDCQYCGNQMWVSERKRTMSKMNGSKLVCWICFFTTILPGLGIDPREIEAMDILKLNKAYGIRYQ